MKTSSNRSLFSPKAAPVAAVPVVEHTKGDKVYVPEHGAGVRPARVTEVYRREGAQRIKVDFTDDRGGFRDCFGTSVHKTKADAEKGSR